MLQTPPSTKDTAMMIVGGGMMERAETTASLSLTTLAEDCGGATTAIMTPQSCRAAAAGVPMPQHQQQQQQGPGPLSAAAAVTSSSSASFHPIVKAVDFKKDPSNPLNTRFYVSCLQSAKLYVEAVRRAEEAAENGEVEEEESDVHDHVGNQSNETPEAKHNKRLLEKEQANADKDDDGVSPLSIAQSSRARLPSLNHATLGEMTAHIDELKELCSGVTASFLTIDATRAGTTGGANKPANNTSTTNTPSFTVGGATNVLTLACAAFTLEQQALEERYAREIKRLQNGEDSESEDDDNAKKPKPPKPALTRAEWEVVALIDAADAISENATTIKCDANSTNHKITLLDDKAVRESALLAKVPLSTICTLNDVEITPSHDTLMEKQLFGVVSSMCEFAAAVANHVVQFSLQFPVGSPDINGMNRSNTDNGSFRSDSTSSFSVGGAGMGGAAGGSPMSTATSGYTLSPPQNDAAAAHAGVAAVVGAEHLQSPQSPVTPHSSLAAPHAAAAKMMMNRNSSAVFEDTTAAKASLSALTAQLMYHSLAVLTDAMSVYTSDSECDRIVEMLEFYIDRCESALQGVVVNGGVTAEMMSPPSTSTCAPSSAAVSSPTLSSSTSSTSIAAKNPPLSYTQQCIIAARRSNCKRQLTLLYPFRRRIQMFLLNSLKLVEGYLPLVFGSVKRETELTWFAEGFRTFHMQLIANMAHNNRHVARAVVSAKYPTPSAIVGVAASSLVAPTPLTRAADGCCDAATKTEDCGQNAENCIHSPAPLVPRDVSGRLSGGDINTPTGGGTSSACGFTDLALPTTDATPTALKLQQLSADTAADSGESSSVSEWQKKQEVRKKLQKMDPRNAQAKEQEEDLFCSVLQSTGLDQENPAVSEWSEFSVKCMCSVSLTARNRLQELKKLVTEGEADKQNADGADEGRSKKYSYHNTFGGDNGGDGAAAAAAAAKATALSSNAFPFSTTVPPPPAPKVDHWRQLEENFM